MRDGVGVQALLESRLLQFFGFVSYPLYLLHENMLISLLVKSAWVRAGCIRPPSWPLWYPWHGWPG